jgi:hypothetical protein
MNSRACIAILIRAVMVAAFDINNLSRSGMHNSIWTYMESCLGISSACLPFLAKSPGKRFWNIVQAISSLQTRIAHVLFSSLDQTQDNCTDITMLAQRRGLEGSNSMHMNIVGTNSDREITQTIGEVVEVHYV